MNKKNNETVHGKKELKVRIADSANPLSDELYTLQAKCGMRVIYDGKSRILNITDKVLYDNCLIYSETKSEKIKAQLTWNPMDIEWKSRCKERAFWFQSTKEEAKRIYPDMDDRLFDLRNKLLSFAGEAVCLPDYEEDLKNLLMYGQFWIGYHVKMMLGEPCHCHSNVANLWEQNKDATNICTGYALSKDGMWRQHSWLLWRRPRSNQIVETTKPRICYYGFAMPREMCERFADANQ